MIVSTEKWLDRPLLHIYKEQMPATAPVVIFVHGFTSAKEHNLHYAYHLVEQGVRVIMPDAPLHGERSKNYSKQQMEFEFWNIILQTVKEIGELHGELLKRGYQPSKIGMGGTSMGGIVTSGSLRVYDWIDTAAICMGVTSYSKFAKYQIEAMEATGIQFPLSQQQKTEMIEHLAPFDLEKDDSILNDKPIIFWHGVKDDVVPFFLSHPFFEKQQQENKTAISQFIIDEKAAHAVSRQGVLNVTKWLVQHLA